MAASINGGGVLGIEVTAPTADSALGRIVHIVDGGSHRRRHPSRRHHQGGSRPRSPRPRPGHRPGQDRHLTRNRPVVVEVVPTQSGAQADQVLQVAAGLEARSAHPRAAAILAAHRGPSSQTWQGSSSPPPRTTGSTNDGDADPH